MEYYKDMTSDVYKESKMTHKKAIYIDIKKQEKQKKTAYAIKYIDM